MSKKRKALSKKLRFEVFKRDKFTCQYCGKQAPDVILEVDHVHPVSKGGEDELLNLLTSCEDCNSGKGARTLADDSVLAKQRNQLEKLAERREQIDMMMDWSRGMKESRDYEVQAVAGRWTELVSGSSLNERGILDVKKWLKKFPLAAVLNAMETAVDQYIGTDPSADKIEKAFKSIPGITRIQSLPEGERELYYIRGIVRARLGCISYSDQSFALQLMRDALAAGAAIEDLRDAAKRARNWSVWVNIVEGMIPADRESHG